MFGHMDMGRYATAWMVHLDFGRHQALRSDSRWRLHTGTTINSEIRPADPERILDPSAMRSGSAGLQSPLLPAAEQAPSAAGPSDGPAAQRRLDVDDVLRLDEFSDASHLSTLRTRFLRQAAAPGGKNAFKACRKLRRAVVRQLSRDKAERAAVVGRPQLDDAREHVRFFLPKTSSGELLSLRCSEKEFSKHVALESACTCASRR